MRNLRGRLAAGKHAGPTRRVVALVRHPTPDVPPGLCYGRLDVPLADRAAGETERLIAAFADWPAATVWSSPRRRCRIPAEAIARAGQAAGAVRIDDRLREMDFGAWEGQPWSAIDRAALDAWAACIAGYTPPDGENGASLIARVTAFWRALPPGAHVIVTHGGPLKVLRALAHGCPIDLASLAPAYASIEILEACAT